MKKDGPISWISIHAVGSLPSGAVASFEGVNAEKAVKEVANQTKHTPSGLYIAPRTRIAGPMIINNNTAIGPHRYEQ
jgi:hypothetical protein